MDAMTINSTVKLETRYIHAVLDIRTGYVREFRIGTVIFNDDGTQKDDESHRQA